MQSAYSQKAYVPDANFRTFINTNFPTVMDSSGDSIIISEANTITGSFTCASQNIADLTGLEYFINIQYLHCYGNQLTSLPDISGLTKLVFFYCNNNQLTELPDMSGMNKLQRFDCSYNNLTTIPDLSAAAYTLQWLICEYNELTSLPDLNQNRALERLYCNDNNLQHLPDMDMTLLVRLYAWRNELVDLPNLPYKTLESFSCDMNQISIFPDLSNFTELTSVYASANYFENLPDLSAASNLTSFTCYNNKLDFSDAKELRIINTLPNLSVFSYYGQKAFGKDSTMTYTVGDSAYISIAAQDSAVSYQWYKNGEAINGATDTSLIINPIAITDSGTYTCKSFGTALLAPPLISGEGISEFTSAEIKIIVNDTTTNNTEIQKHQLSIYPNPNNGEFSISTDQGSDISLYNTNGQIIWSKAINKGTTTIEIKEKGIYFLKTSSKTGTQTSKIIVEK